MNGEKFEKALVPGEKRELDPEEIEQLGEDMGGYIQKLLKRIEEVEVKLENADEKCSKELRGELDF